MGAWIGVMYGVQRGSLDGCDMESKEGKKWVVSWEVWRGEGSEVG